jgi:hypothetical protein
MGGFDGPGIPPSVTFRSPDDGAINVSRSTGITVGFNVTVVGVDASSFTVMDGASAATGIISQLSGTHYNFAPDMTLMASSTVTVSLSSAIMDTSGNALVPSSWSFQTGL